MTDEQKPEETKPESAEEKKEEQPQTEVKEEAPAETQKEEQKPEEKPAEEAKEEPKEEKPEPSGKFKDLIKKIEELSALELAELVKELEERFGVSAAAPVAAAAAPAGGGEAGAEEEKSSFTVELADAGAQKINVIKAIREVVEMGLKEAKDLVDSAPKVIKENVPKEEAEEAKKKLEEAGAKVNLK